MPKITFPILGSCQAVMKYYQYDEIEQKITLQKKIKILILTLEKSDRDDFYSYIVTLVIFKYD